VKHATTLLAAGILMTLAPAQGASAQPFEVGQPFPELLLPDLEDGRPTSLQRFRGRPLVLHVFASW
jgi:hypothetical protein